MKRLTGPDLDQAIANLTQLNTKQLQYRWREIFKGEPPLKMREGFLRLAIAYRLQERALGGLSASANRKLDRHADDMAKSRLAITQGLAVRGTLPVGSKAPAPGSRLMREWNGTTEIVDVVDAGYFWRGKPYRTLSAVAVAITGTKWSGPKFFGLQQASSIGRTPNVHPSSVEAAP